MDGPSVKNSWDRSFGSVGSVALVWFGLVSLKKLGGEMALAAHQ
jgi:hypothetical protein